MGEKEGNGMLSDNLLALRKRRKLTQEQVAGAIGVSRQALSKWETGESVPDVENCVALAAFYDVSLDDLVRYASCSITKFSPSPSTRTSPGPRA